ncbi:MAG TPA: acyl-CoA dehydrogenase family protein [Dehalococcoidia bacterium]|nr:acyl-CoA dehydrogenase family protein [Dehalococcoidia bacterium]
MDFTISEEHRLLAQPVRRFVQEELIPLERSGHELPADLQQSLRRRTWDLGLFMMHVPQEYGGGGVDTVGMCLVLEETAQTAVEADYIFGIDQPVNLLFYGNDAQKAKYLDPVVRGEKYFGFALSEPNAGSDAQAIQTTAVRDGDNWILNGSKLWISRMWVADFAVVFAVTDKLKRARGGITAFIVEKGTPGFEVLRLVPVMEEPSSRGPTELSLKDVVVPAENVLGEEGFGFRIAQARLGAQRAYIAARCIGAARRALDLAVSYSKQRITFGEPLASRQGIQWMLADAALEIHAAHLMTLECAWRWDQGLPMRAETSFAKLFASEMVCRVIDMSMQIHGGLGYSKELPLERLYRRMRLYRIGEGASEIHRNVIAKQLFMESA